ncbi:Restriction of telomere capping protein 5 [Mortierella polycephala]|uniref:Restriction of telomere capping protein 5 n=1 Tax=Mortierella polycephala TaxID=41804 RepID=A0A9P6PNP1_9FUNG|nr:Restriction of telomere capping protein 5 [Mortierella polycephala]
MGLSWTSKKMHKDILSKFTELERLSLRQVFQQLKEHQDSMDLQQYSEHPPETQQDAMDAQSQKSSRPVPGITEATFVEYIGIPADKNRAGELLFRSFYNLSVYPDSRSSLPTNDQPRNLLVRDFIKPIALYCHKVTESTLIDVNPLKAIFESFTENATALPIKTAATADNISQCTDESPPQERQDSIKTSKTIEDSLRDLAADFEWNPEDSNNTDSGPEVKALDLVEVLDGLFWLTQKLIEDNQGSIAGNQFGAHGQLPNGSHRKRAIRIVEHIVQYSRSSSSVHEPVDLSATTIDYGMFSKYVSRNAPNMFAALSPHFYNLFLIGKTLRPTGVNTAANIILPGISTIPVLSSPSVILTPENLALISWFLPRGKTTPTLTNLYVGSQHGFSMNQFEVHVCKYPAPTVLLLLVERQSTTTPTVKRRPSINFETSLSRHRHSISNNSPSYATTWGTDYRRASVDKLAVPPGGALNTNYDSSGGTSAVADEMNHPPPGNQGNTAEAGVVPATPRKDGKERMILGAYVTEPWKVSKSGWGNDSFALFELSPCFEVFPAKKSSPGLSSSTRSPTSSRSLPDIDPRSTLNRHYIHFLKTVGVGFGGQESESCMLYMDDNLHYGSYRQDFAGGNVYVNAGGARQVGFEVDFEIVDCEVWGLGGPEAKARQQKEWDFEQREANRRATIRIRSKDGEQDIDRDLLELAACMTLFASAAPLAHPLSTEPLRQSRRQEPHPEPDNDKQPDLDPCTTLGQLEEPDITWAHVQQCYNNVPYNATEANIILSTLYTLYRDYYIFLDMAMLENQPKPFTNPPVDILRGLDQISMQEYHSDFRFQTDIDLLVNRLNDAHANYMIYCYRHYLFQQPIDLYAPVINNIQTVRILQDRSNNGLEECQVLTIDGANALDAIQSWVDIHVGISKDAGVRLNKALTHLLFNTATKQWRYSLGQFTSRLTLPERQTTVYHIRCPASEEFPEGRDQFLDVDWDVFRLMSWNEFDSTESFQTQNCFRDTDPKLNENVQPARSDFLEHWEHHLDMLSSASAFKDSTVEKMVRRRAQKDSLHAAVEIPRHRTIRPMPTIEKRQYQDVKVANLIYNGTSTAFYQLVKRPNIGVVVIPTHTVNMKSETQILIDGFVRLGEAGVENVILDLTGNGGGYVNFAYDLVDWMFPNENQTSVYESDLRASMSVKALAQKDLQRDDYASYFNPDSFSDPVTGEQHDSNFFIQDKLERRVQHRLGYSSRVFMNHRLGYFDMDMPWQHDAQRIVVMTDGACGSACGMTLNRLKNRHGVQSYAVGGRAGEDLSLFSFPGASVYPLDDIINDFENLGVDSPMQRLRYRGIYRVPVMEFFQEEDPIPIEYNPKLFKADFHLDYTPITARHHEVLWEVVANNHWKDKDVAL